MTTLYKPVLIESAEQAEALHEKAIIITYSPRGEAWEAALREDVDAEAITPDGGWYCQTLAPIEAEEETYTYANATSRTRYVTPWESA